MTRSATRNRVFRSRGRRVRLSKIGDVSLVLHRPLEGDVKTCRVRRAGTGKWYVSFSCAVASGPRLPAIDSQVGIDVGLAVVHHPVNG